MNSTLITANHRLPFDNIEELANELAHAFNVSVDYGYWDNGSIEDIGFQSMNRIENPESEMYADLIDNKLMNSNQQEYIFEIGEVAIKIYKDLLTFDYPFEYNINDLLDNKWEEHDTLKHLHIDLEKLGANEVLYAEDSNFEASTILTQKEQTWVEFKSNIQQNLPNFVVQL